MEPFADPPEFESYHRSVLPDLLAEGRGALAARGAASLGPLAFRLPSGDAFTYVPEAGGIALRPGDEGAKTVVELAPESWAGLVQDLESAPGLLYSGRVHGARGDLMEFVRWEPALRALYTGRPVYDPEDTSLAGANGVPLDPTRSFALADDDAVLAEHLRVLGYVLVRNVFDAEDVATLLEEAATLRERAVEGDQRSWWAKHADGTSICCRVIHAGGMPRIGALHDDPRVVRLGKLTDYDLVARKPGQDEGASVLWKLPDIAEGLADLPWHRDCGMGGHAITCPAINLSVHLGPANPDAGDLRFLPGSWRASVGFAEGDDANAPGGISIDARPGDVSLHYGDVVHAAPPPRSKTGPFRTSILIGFEKPGVVPHTGDRHYNDALFQGEASEVPDLRTVASRREGD